ncbi:MAG: hypothetical protein MHMPM18_002974 [Marteilia pararefringens]
MPKSEWGESKFLLRFIRQCSLAENLLNIMQIELDELSLEHPYNNDLKSLEEYLIDEYDLIGDVHLYAQNCDKGVYEFDVHLLSEFFKSESQEQVKQSDGEQILMNQKWVNGANLDDSQRDQLRSAVKAIIDARMMLLDLKNSDVREQINLSPIYLAIILVKNISGHINQM